MEALWTQLGDDLDDDSEYAAEGRATILKVAWEIGPLVLHRNPWF